MASERLPIDLLLVHWSAAVRRRFQTLEAGHLQHSLLGSALVQPCCAMHERQYAVSSFERGSSRDYVSLAESAALAWVTKYSP